MDEIKEIKNRTYSLKRAQYKLALRLLSTITEDGLVKKVLDVGCGMGEFADILRNKGKELVCVDGFDKYYKFVLSKGFESYKVNLEYEKIPLEDNSFDLVVSLEVIEHLWNTDNYLKEINRLLKPGGYALFTTMNYNYLTYRIRHLLGNFEKFTYKSRHKKFYTAKSLKKELENYFEIKKILGIIILPKIHIINKRFINLLSLDVGILCRKNKN